jgi:hypothetical protein
MYRDGTISRPDYVPAGTLSLYLGGKRAPTILERTNFSISQRQMRSPT